MNNDDILAGTISDLLKRVGELEKKEMPAPNVNNAVGAILGLPALRGFWTCGNNGGASDLRDIGGNGNQLNRNGTPNLATGFPAGGGAFPNAVYQRAGGDYYSATTDFAAAKITGADSGIEGGWQGLTLGICVWADVLQTQNVFSKWDVSGNQRSYLLNMATAGGLYRFFVSSDGTATVQVDAPVSVAVDTWSFLVAKFTPSTELSLFLNGIKSANTTSIPASIFNSSAFLAIAAASAGTSLLDGRTALAFLCAAALSDATIYGLWEVVKPLFGSASST